MIKGAHMSNKIKIMFVILGLIEGILVVMFLLGSSPLQILDPKGLVARQQRDLIVQVVGLMLIVAIPLLTTLSLVAYKFRDGNKKTVYKAEAHASTLMIIGWWLVPSVFVFMLALITWNKTHALDPYRPLASNVAPVKIQVVALQWKWLFFYPDYDVATLNFVQFPEKTPINFELTADAPMNSFWIPSLAGQIYAMTGMSTKLHVMADAPGDFPGQAGEINGKGFSTMKFIARASTKEDFDKWIGEVRMSSKTLNRGVYDELSEPSLNMPITFYGSYSDNLYHDIIMKFMPSMHQNHSEQTLKH
jgi:cytochrome o ubiquinol oxidase subunit II